MKKLLFLVFIIIAGLLQVTVLSTIALWGVKPDLLLMLVVIGSFLFDLKFAVVSSIIAGIWKDICGINAFGIHALLCVVWCLGVVVCSRKISADNRVVRTVILGAVMVCNGAVLRFLNSSGAIAPTGISLCIIAVESTYTALLFALCFDQVAKIAVLLEDRDARDTEDGVEAGREPDRDGLLY